MSVYYEKHYKEESKKVFRSFLNQAGISQRDAADFLGISSSSLSNKLSRGSLSFAEFLQVIEAVSYKIVFEKSQEGLTLKDIKTGDLFIFDKTESELIKKIAKRGK
jgi:hypothetical protein